MPDAEQVIFGGMVKLHDLNKAFPQCTSAPNILYLVSSALPYFPIRMARAVKRAGAKIVLNQNGVAYPGWHGKGWEDTNKAMKILIHMADHVIYQSQFCKLSADRFLGPRQGDTYDILNNPVDTEFFRPANEPERSSDKIMLLLAGSHWSPYRVNVALKTLGIVRSENKRVHLRIAGRFCWHGDESLAHREVVEYAQQLGVADYVEKVGPYLQSQAPAMMQQCAILATHQIQ